MNILVTGATGFVGLALCDNLESANYNVRRSNQRLSELDWSDSLAGVETVVHLAARVHIMQDKSTDPLEEFRAVNVKGTINLARQAALAGVNRFVFLSSIGVNGAVTELNRPFTSEDKLAPHSLYAISKHEAEIGLRDIAVKTGMQVVIIRPPLVYGVNAPGNFGSLIRILHRGIPLPLGLAYENRRSFVSLPNLIDFIITCINHPNAANETFLVSDGEDVSTADLLRKIAHAQNVPSRLLPVPLFILKWLAKVFGKSDIEQRLLGNLQVDITKNKMLLGWQPPFTLEQGLDLMVKGKNSDVVGGRKNEKTFI